MGRKTKRTYEHVTLNVTSKNPVTEGKLQGILTPSGVGGAEFNFEEVAEDKSVLIVGERKWIPIKVNKQYGLRVTKNKETGEYRILCSLTKEKLQHMTLRQAGELEAEFGLMVEKIRL